MCKLEIEVNDRVARELYIFCKEQKENIVIHSGLCDCFLELKELEEAFKIYDTIEFKLEELN